MVLIPAKQGLIGQGERPGAPGQWLHRTRECCGASAWSFPPVKLRTTAADLTDRFPEGPDDELARMETDRFLPGEPLYRLSGDVDPKDGARGPQQRPVSPVPGKRAPS